MINQNHQEYDQHQTDNEDHYVYHDRSHICLLYAVIYAVHGSIHDQNHVIIRHHFHGYDGFPAIQLIKVLQILARLLNFLDQSHMFCL